MDLAARLSGRDDSAAMLNDLAQRHALVEQVLLNHGLGLVLAGAGTSVQRAIDLLPPSRDKSPAVLVHGALLAVDEGPPPTRSPRSQQCPMTTATGG